MTVTARPPWLSVGVFMIVGLRLAVLGHTGRSRGLVWARDGVFDRGSRDMAPILLVWSALPFSVLACIWLWSATGWLPFVRLLHSHVVVAASGVALGFFVAGVITSEPRRVGSERDTLE